GHPRGATTAFEIRTIQTGGSMKTSTRALTVAVVAGLLLSAPTAWGQSQMDKLKNTTPVERATVQTEMIKTKLGLSPEQAEKISAINLKYANRMEPVIKGSEGPFRKMRQAREINEAKEGELRQVLSPDQFQKYLADREQMRERFEEKMEQKKSGR